MGLDARQGPVLPLRDVMIASWRSSALQPVARKAFEWRVFFCTIPILSALIASCAPPPPDATGYVEGEFVLVAPVATARLETLAVRRGDRVEKGQALAMQERRDAEIALAGAASALAQAESRLADL
jgi:HlyD family secretion protein